MADAPTATSPPAPSPARTPPAALPGAVDRALRRVDRRLRAVRALRGLGRLASALALAAAAAMAVDFAFGLPAALRWGGWLAWVGLGAAGLALGVVGPLARRTPRLALAALVERTHPGLGERLTGAVGLVESGPAPHGSPELVAAAAGAVTPDAAAIRPGLAAPWKRGAPPALVGLALASLAVAPALTRPDPFADLARRFLAPWAAVDRVGRFAVEVRGPALAAVGSDAAIEAGVRDRLAGLALPGLGTFRPPETALLEWEGPDGRRGRAAMRRSSTDAGPEAAARFEAVIPALAGLTTYRVRSGPDVSRDGRIEAVEAPAVARLEIQTTAPAYRGGGSTTRVDPARVEVPEGSTVAIRLAPSAPLLSGRVRFRAAEGVVEPVYPLVQDENRWWTFRFGVRSASAEGLAVIERPGAFAFELQEAVHGLVGRDDRPRRFEVLRDAPPTVAMEAPGDDSEAKPDDLLMVDVLARDDAGVASAELHYAIRRPGAAERSGVLAVPLDAPGRAEARGVVALGLDALLLKPGDAVSYRARAVDNRPEGLGGPQEGWSPGWELTIAADAPPLLARRDAARRAGVQKRLDELKRDAAANRREAEALRHAADAARRGGGTWDDARRAALDAREAAARSVADRLQVLARDLEADARLRPLARPARQAAEVEAEGARARLDAARSAPDDARRLAELRAADARLGAVQSRLDDLQRRFDALATRDADRDRLHALAAREDRLAARAAEAEADAEALRAEQESLRREVDELTKKSPELRGLAAAAQAAEADALAERARDLAARQRELARASADPDRQDALLRALALAQRDLEADARRLALDVDAPLAENGLGRLDAEALRRPVDPIERGDLEPARQQMEQAEAALRRLARDLDELPDDARALARRLARRQDELARRVDEALRDAPRNRAPAPAEKAALAETLAPLAARQEALNALVAAVRPPAGKEGPAREAAERADRALAGLRDPDPREAGRRLAEARDALNRLADQIPEPHQLRQPARQAAGQARQAADEVAREVERHVRETEPPPGKPADPSKIAGELSRRLEHAARREAEALQALEQAEAGPATEPWRDRAAARAGAVAEALARLKDLARAAGDTPAGALPVESWRVVGPFAKDAPPPFDPARPVDFGAALAGLDGIKVGWREVRAGRDGLVDLGAAGFGVPNRSAFASAELARPSAGPAEIVVGSDDTLTVWVGGRRVFHFGGNRAFSPGQDRFVVDLAEGPNRLVVRCGNGDGDWKFALAASPPPPENFDLAAAKDLRAALPGLAADALAAASRLEDAFDGRQPADALAAELAAEQGKLAERVEEAAKDGGEPDPALAAEQRRIEAALHALPAPDAGLARSEAARLAAKAARALESGEADAASAVAEAAEAAGAAGALADRLADRDPARARAETLAKAARALADPRAADGPAGSARLGRSIAAELARLPGPAVDRRPAAEALSRAVAAAERASASTEPPDPSGFAEAADALGALAANLPGAPPAARALPPRPGPPDDPELGVGPGQAAEATALARRQRQIRERLQSLFADQVGPQDGLRREAEVLGRELAGLRDRARELAPQAQGPADQAADLVGQQAPRAMAEGAERLAQARPGPARDAQRRAAEVAERGGQAAEDLAAALRAARPPDSDADAPRSGPGRPSGDLAAALAALRQAEQQLARAAEGPGQPGSPGPASAGESMRRAAEGLRSAARGGQPQDEGQGPGEPGSEPGPAGLADRGENPAGAEGTPGDPKGGPAGVASADLSQLQDALRRQTGRAWGELPGHLRTELLQLSQGRYRDDYARLIQLYFREIASGAAGDRARPPSAGDGP